MLQIIYQKIIYESEILEHHRDDIIKKKKWGICTGIVSSKRI